MTALHLCTLANQPQVAQALLVAGADQSVLNESKQTCAMLADQLKHVQVAAILSGAAKKEEEHGSIADVGKYMCD
jgi:ankyrin repeat protein